MLLTGPEIARLVAAGALVIDPLVPAHVGANSVDVVLGPGLKLYRAQLAWLEAQRGLSGWHLRCMADPAFGPTHADVRPALDESWVLDPERPNPTVDVAIPDDPGGLVLVPGLVYIGATVEWTETPHPYAPMLEGRSTWGRLGVSVHQTAGVGDCGFRGRWVVEITVLSPVRVRRDQRIAQLMFHRTEGGRAEYKGKYQDQTGATPARPLAEG